MVVHVDKVKQCLGETPMAWLGTETYYLVPTAMEQDVLPNMFGGIDRGGIDTAADDIATNIIVRPKRNTCVPAHFLSRIYAVHDNALSYIYDYVKNERDYNNELCLYRFIDMK